MRLNQLIDCCCDIEITGITTDSRKVKKGYLFIATKGFNVDHYDFIDDAIKKGAAAVIVDREGDFSVPTIHVSDINQSLVSVCESFYNVSSSDFSFIGITGTDGKTTTAIMVRNLLNSFIPTAYIGTNGVYCGDNIYTISNTTPCVEELYHLFSVVKRHKCKVIVMEVSSEALLHHRVDSILFKVVAFTNITEDHLNIHKTLDNYRECKFRLAELCSSNALVFINGDDDNCQLLPVNSKICYGFSDVNQYVISDVKECQENVIFTVSCHDKKYFFCSPFLGIYNIYNVTLAWLIARVFVPFDDKLIALIPTLPNILGRRELFSDIRGFDILLDYAHTEYAILNLLQSLTNYRRIIVVTGAAGGREVEKRSHIGDVLFQYADYIIFTMDDPRYEDPKKIANDMIGNHATDKFVFIRNRDCAIAFAFQYAKKGDVVAVIGKGRDNYMAIEDRRDSYCDYDVIMKYMKKS